MIPNNLGFLPRPGSRLAVHGGAYAPFSHLLSVHGRVTVTTGCLHICIEAFSTFCFTHPNLSFKFWVSLPERLACSVQQVRSVPPLKSGERDSQGLPQKVILKNARELRSGERDMIAQGEISPNWTLTLPQDCHISRCNM